MSVKAIDNKQNGAVLAISLIILLVLTLMVVSGNRTVLMQEKMVAATLDAQVSLADAELGLRAAETTIENLTGTGSFSDTGSGGYYSMDDGPVDVFASANWVDSKILFSSITTSVTNNPATYYVEDVGIIPELEEDLSGINMMGYGQTVGGGDVNAFRVVSRATGNTGSAERIVVGYYGKRL